MKREFAFLLMFVVSISLVSAFAGLGDPIEGLGRGMNQLIEVVEVTLGPFFSVILGGQGDFLFERVLFFFIIASLVYLSISRIPMFEDPDRKGVRWIVVIAVSLLSSRFFDGSNLIQNMILPYSILGVTISAVLPLVIYFFFVESFDSSTIRKVMWTFFIIIFIGIWASRYPELGSLSYIYFFIGLAAFLFLLFDRPIRRIIQKQKWGVEDLDGRLRIVAKLRRDLGDLERDYARNRIPKESYRRMKKRLLRQIKDLRKH